jgi:hypothetical protein
MRLTVRKTHWMIFKNNFDRMIPLLSFFCKRIAIKFLPADSFILLNGKGIRARADGRTCSAQVALVLVFRQTDVFAFVVVYVLRLSLRVRVVVACTVYCEWLRRLGSG